ncbi:MAG: NADH-quinone oxidoreductase subunit C [Actinomycetota bacterium]
MTPGELAERLRDRLPDVFVARGETSAVVAREEIPQVLAYLRDEPDLAFDFLADVSCTDWPGRAPRIWMVYHLKSRAHGHRLRIRAGLPEGDLRLPSITDLFPTADFQEREVYDLFGVVFEAHPDLRRILMPEDWEGHPLRKDHPLGGVRTRYKGAFVPPPDERGL